MKKLSGILLCFEVGAKEVIKYGGNLNLKGFSNTLVSIQVNKRI